MPRKTRNPALLPVAMTLALQAPLVVWMRMPMIFMEMATGPAARRRPELERAVSEKIGAVAESAGSLHVEAARWWTQMLLGAMSGSIATQPFGWERHWAAALEPYSRRVKGNAVRLQRRTP